MNINTKKEIDTKNTKGKFVFKGLLGLSVAMSLIYIFFIGKIVFNIVDRKNIETEMRDISSSVSSLQVEYFNLNNKIDLAYAKSIGFSESSSVVFAHLSTETHPITLR